MTLEILWSVTKNCAIYLDIPQGTLEAVALRLHFRPNKHQHAYHILWLNSSRQYLRDCLGGVGGGGVG